MPQDRKHSSRIFVCILTSLLCFPVFAGSLVVQLDNNPKQATVHAALMSMQDNSWDAEPVAVTSSESATVIFENIPAGRYAIQLFADSNGNGQLDSSPRGIPLEPVGFSNNPSLLRGMPSVAQCIFHHSGGETPLQIRLTSSTPLQRKLAPQYK